MNNRLDSYLFSFSFILFSIYFNFGFILFLDLGKKCNMMLCVTVTQVTKYNISIILVI